MNLKWPEQSSDLRYLSTSSLVTWFDDKGITENISIYKANIHNGEKIGGQKTTYASPIWNKMLLFE